MRRIKKPRRVIGRSRKVGPFDDVRIHRSSSTLGPDIVTADFEDVMTAIEAAPRGDDWQAVGAAVIPVLPRVRPQPPGFPAPLRTIVPPGIAVGFGVDIGPAFLAVSRDQLASLGITELELVTRGLANLAARAEQVEPAEVIRQNVDGVAVMALQTGRSIGSTLVLVPDQLARIFGPEPRLFIAPMRDVIFGFPPDVDPSIVGELYEMIASQDPNCLPPTGYRFDGRSVSIVAIDAEPPLPQRLLA